MNRPNPTHPSKKHIKSPYVTKKDFIADIPDPNETEALDQDGTPSPIQNANFQTELEYDGYEDIENYDNDAYGADVDGKGDPERKLNFKDRPEEENGEEDLLDPQENQK